MKKRTLISIIVFIIIFTGVVIVGIMTRNSYINNVDISNYSEKDNVYLEITDHTEDVTKDFKNLNEIKTLKDLEANTPIIAKVKVNPNSKRDQYYLTTLTNVQVLDVYKGSIPYKNIDIFEPISGMSLEDPKEDFISSLDGYNLMNDGKEYIVFLKELKDVNYSENKTVYMPTTTILSKYEVSNDTINKLKPDDKIKYSDVKNQEVLLTDENLIKKFNNFKDEVIKKYNAKS